MSKAGCVTRLLLLVVITVGLGYLFFDKIYIPDQTPFRENVIENESHIPYKKTEINSQQELDSLIRVANMYYGNSYIDSILLQESNNAKLLKIRILVKDKPSVAVKPN